MKKEKAKSQETKIVNNKEKNFIKFPIFDDSNVKEAEKEMSDFFKSSAERIFENAIAKQLPDKSIYCNESLALLDKVIKKIVVEGSEDEKNLFILYAGSYLGQFVISKFNGIWVEDGEAYEDILNPLNYFIRYGNSDSYFRPFASIVNRVENVKKTPLMSEINIIEKNIKQYYETNKRLRKAFGKDYDRVINKTNEVLAKIKNVAEKQNLSEEEYEKEVTTAAKALNKVLNDADKRRR
jgi:hypothetical protein